MKETKMYCEVCGKEFYSEYYVGGYIDHMNLVDNRDLFARQCENNFNEGVRTLVDKIIFDSNRIRGIYDIEIRLACVLEWDCLSNEVKEKVESIVFRYINEYKRTLNIVDELKKRMSPLTVAMLDSQNNNVGYRKFVCELYEAYGV